MYTLKTCTYQNLILETICAEYFVCNKIENVVTLHKRDRNNNTGMPGAKA